MTCNPFNHLFKSPGENKRILFQWACRARKEEDAEVAAAGSQVPGSKGLLSASDLCAYRDYGRWSLLPGSPSTQQCQNRILQPAPPPRRAVLCRAFKELLKTRNPELLMTCTRILLYLYFITIFNLLWLKYDPFQQKQEKYEYCSTIKAAGVAIFADKSKYQLFTHTFRFVKGLKSILDGIE